MIDSVLLARVGPLELSRWMIFKCQCQIVLKRVYSNLQTRLTLRPCPHVPSLIVGGGGWVSFARSPSLVSDRFSLHIVNIETLKLFLYLNTCWSTYSYPKNNLLIIIIWVECLYHHRWVKWMKQFLWALHTPTKLLKQGRKIVSYSRCTNLGTLIIGKN